MGEEDTIVFIRNEMDISRARRVAKSLCESLNFNPPDIFSLVTSVSELATNIVFHAVKGGRIHFRPIREEKKAGIEIMAEDEGPGIFDIRLAMTDGYSSTGGLGGGLPGVKRLMDYFRIESEFGKKTIVIAGKWKNENRHIQKSI